MTDPLPARARQQVRQYSLTLQRVRLENLTYILTGDPYAASTGPPRVRPVREKTNTPRLSNREVPGTKKNAKSVRKKACLLGKPYFTKKDAQS
jgi:hypothetical protein